MSNDKLSVGILGATGMVGQEFISRLSSHPWFQVSWLGASERSAGKRFEDAVPWRLPQARPDFIRAMEVNVCKPGSAPEIIFSGLDSSVAGKVEADFAKEGHIVVSNARNFRMDADVPLLVPEINPEHLDLISVQKQKRNWSGCIVTNPNCSTIVLTMAIAPLCQFGLQAVNVTTLQAVSGAGHPGVSSFDIVGNIIPQIPGEEEKIELETKKILGKMSTGNIEEHGVTVSAHTTRVGVLNGHTEMVSVSLKDKPNPSEVIDAFRGFKGRPQNANLPTAPMSAVEYLLEPDRPQPNLDVNRGDGMTVTVGRLRKCPVLGYKFVVLGHNTVRGAAGAAILNAELMKADGFFEK
tara:strand:- start:57 stop:1112 length:1056 start_codon:yes stop_codon:yes gene_type:complete